MSGEIKTMKTCKYCGSENSDEAKTCASCGAKEFSYKCENCGTLLLDGNFCPKCGVKYGTKPKRCPRCGAEYYSNACPDCGYRNSNHGNTSHAGMEGNSIQKRKTKEEVFDDAVEELKVKTYSGSIPDGTCYLERNIRGFGKAQGKAAVE